MTPPLELAVVGAGHMGANHARVIAESSRARLAVVVDADIERAQRLAAATGAVATTELDRVAGCHGAVVATPTANHHGVAMALLSDGVPLLVEKPVTTDLDDTRKLLAESARRGLPLACGFVERFNPVVQTAAALLDGPPVHLLAVRHSPRNGAGASSVVYDVLIHDIDIALLLGGGPVVDVQAMRVTPPGRPCAELADATVRFANGAIATFSANRLGQRKVRTFSIATETALVELDLLRQDITVYRHVHHEQLGDGGIGYRAETVMDIPFVRSAGEPLARQLDHFCDLLDGTADAGAERASVLPAHEVAAAMEAG